MEAGFPADLREQDACYLITDSFSIVGIPVDLSYVRVSVNLRSYLIVYIGLCTIFTKIVIQHHLHFISLLR
jgi:hypothetical protein